MTLAWRTCLWGELGHSRQAEFLAASVGEKEHFDARMRPLLAERDEQRKAGRTVAEVSPEFMINLIRTSANDGAGK
jgi:hypothetical protein